MSVLSFGVCAMSYFYFPLSVTGARVGAGLRAGLVAGLRVGQAYGVFHLPGFGLADYQPPGSWAPNLHLRHRR